jgi:hypothetical protein
LCPPAGLAVRGFLFEETHVPALPALLQGLEVFGLRPLRRPRGLDPGLDGYQPGGERRQEEGSADGVEGPEVVGLHAHLLECGRAALAEEALHPNLERVVGAEEPRPPLSSYPEDFLPEAVDDHVGSVGHGSEEGEAREEEKEGR